MNKPRAAAYTVPVVTRKRCACCYALKIDQFSRVVRAEN